MRRQMKKTYFTLLELMISMGVFAVLMLGLMQFFTSAQNLWTKSNSTTEVFDNARIAMNLLSNDLATAYYEFNHNNKKAFMAYGEDDSSPNPKDIFAFATVRGSVASQNAVSRLTEVFYVLDGTNLKLRSISDVQAAGVAWVTKEMNAPIALWSDTAFFFNSPLGVRTINEEYHVIIPNVLVFDLQFYRKDPVTKELSKMEDASGMPDRNLILKNYPYMITITLTLVDADTVTKLKAIDKNINLSDVYNPIKNKSPAEIETVIANESNPIKKTQYSLLAKSIQTFSRSIVIDRGQYD